METVIERAGVTDAVQPECPPRIVDAHHHLWDLNAGHYPWLQEDYDAKTFILGEYEPLTHNFMPTEYLAARGNAKVVATVHIEAERARNEQLDETRWLHEIKVKWGFPNAVVAHAWLDQPDCDELLQAHIQYPFVRGIRCKPLTTQRPDDAPLARAGTMRDPAWQNGLALLEKYDLSLDLRVPYWHLAEAADVTLQFPQLRIALNHAGLPWDRSEDGLAHWRKGMARLADNPNVMVKLSEFGLRDSVWDYAGNARIVADVLAIFGADRCMFGSNFPVASLRIGYEPLVKNMQRMLGDLTARQQDAVFCSNALDFYRIGPFLPAVL